MKTTNKLKICALSVLSMSIVACSVPPRVDTAVVAMPNVPIEAPFRVMDEGTLSDGQTPSMAGMRWQDFYTDPKLKALIEMGLENNKDIQKTILAINRAKAQYQITEKSNIPSVSLGADVGRGARAGGSSSTSYGVTLGASSYELDFWGKVASEKESALHTYLATNYAKDTAQIALIANIASSYVNLSYAIALRQLALETLKTREHSLMITQERFKAGVDAKSPSLQAESSLEMAKIEIYKADTDILKARNALQLLIGSPVPNELLPEMAVNDIISPTIFSTGLPSELLYYRPDIVKAEHELRSAGANINVARAAYFPSISLSSSLGLSSASLGDLFKSGAFGWSIGPKLSFPIFDAGARRAQYQMAEIDQKSKLVSYESVIQTAFKEVNDVLATRATLGHQLDSQYRLQKNYQETYDIALARFRSGLDDYLSVLDAERSLFANQQSILRLEQSKIASQIELYQVLGGGATLIADQVTASERQLSAMQTASLATTEQVEEVFEELGEEYQRYSVALVQPKPENINVVEPENLGGVSVKTDGEVKPNRLTQSKLDRPAKTRSKSKTSVSTEAEAPTVSETVTPVTSEADTPVVIEPTATPATE